MHTGKKAWLPLLPSPFLSSIFNNITSLQISSIVSNFDRWRDHRLKAINARTRTSRSRRTKREMWSTWILRITRWTRRYQTEVMRTVGVRVLECLSSLGWRKAWSQPLLIGVYRDLFFPSMAIRYLKIIVKWDGQWKGFVMIGWSLRHLNAFGLLFRIRILKSLLAFYLQLHWDWFLGPSFFLFLYLYLFCSWRYKREYKRRNRTTE